MKTLSGIILFSLLSSHLLAQDTLSILDGVSKKLISVSPSGNGGIGRDAARLQLKNNVGLDYVISVPAGLILHSEDPNAQDLVILENLLVDLPKRGNISINAFGACTQIKNYSPKRGEKYRLGQLAPKKLTEIATIIAENDMQKTVGQAAVWAFTDGSDIKNVHDPNHIDASWDIAKIIAYHRNENPPTLEEVQTWPPSGERIVFSARADLTYHAPTDTTVNLGIYDTLGNIVSESFRARKLFAGLHIFTIGLNDILDASTSYFARVTNQNGDVLKEIRLANNEPYVEIRSKRLLLNFEYIVRKPSVVSMSIYDMEDNLIQVLSSGKSLPMSKRSMNLEFLHAFPSGFEMQVKVYSQEGEIFHVEKIKAN